LTPVATDSLRRLRLSGNLLLHLHGQALPALTGHLVSREGVSFTGH